MQKPALVLVALLLAGLPAAATTRVGSVGAAGQRIYGFVPPLGGAQAVVTVSWTQRLNTAIVVLVCGDAIDALPFGASGNLNSDRTARIEAGVFGDSCSVGIQGFGGQVNFRLNVQLSVEEDPVRQQSRVGEDLPLAGGSTRLVRLKPEDAPAVVDALRAVRRSLARKSDAP